MINAVTDSSISKSRSKCHMIKVIEELVDSTPLEASIIKTEKRRWIILLAVSLFSFSNAMSWSTYSLIIDETQKYYDVGTTAFLQFSNIFFYLYVLTSIPVSHFMSDHLSWIILPAALLNSAGGFLRFYAGKSYAIALTGQGLASLAQGCILQLPAVISERWFTSHERSWALLIATFANYLGWAFGNITPCYYFDALPLESAFKLLLQHQMIIMAVPTVLLILFFRSKPKYPPSFAAMIKSKEPVASLRFTLKTLFSNKRFMINSVCLAYMTGTSYTVTSVTSYILEPRHYSNLQMSNVGTAFLIVGIIGGFIGALYLEIKKSTNYDIVLKVLFVTGFLGILGLAVSGDKASFPLVLLFNALAGLGFISFAPFGIESLIESSFPQPESISVAIMISLSQIFGYILNEVTTLPAVGSKGYWVLAALTLPVILYGVFGYKTAYRRTKSEAEERKSFREKAATEAITASEAEPSKTSSSSR